MNHTEQLERIGRMEQHLEEASAALTRLAAALDQYETLRPQMQALAHYCDSGDWLRDYDDDCAGKLPPDLKRGVLSQDALYDLLTEERRLQTQMGRLSGRS